MRLLSDSEVVTLTSEDQDFWHTISNYSSWSYLIIVLGQILFFRDVVFDVYSQYLCAASGEWPLFFETLVVLLGAGSFQSYHYYQEQKWIDADHTYLRQGGTGMNDDVSGSDNSQNAQRASNSSVQSTNNIRASIISTSSMWAKLRCLSQLTLLTPPFRAVFGWKDRKEKEKILMERRARRVPIDRQEIKAAVLQSERDVTNQMLQMIEVCFESLPQSILQIYFASIVGLELQLDVTGCFRLLSIGVSLFMTALTSTTFNRNYFGHLKTLHFQDYFFFGYKTELVGISWTSTLLLFITHLTLICNRVHGIAVMYVVHGQVRALIFVILLYLLQYIWLEMHSSCRLFYENPPRGISTKYSNILDRWMNIFTFHMLKPTYCVIFSYNLIFLGLLSVCTNAFDAIPTLKIFNEFPIPEYNLTMAETNNTAITYNTAFSSFAFVSYSWAVSTIVCGFTGYFLEKQLEPLIKHQFPLMKGFPFWKDVMSAMKWDHVDLAVRRHICLCVLATDLELYDVFDSVCCKLGVGKINYERLEDLWKLKVLKISPAIIENVIQLQLKWNNVKKNRSKNKFMTELISLVDSAFDDGDCVPISDLQLFLTLVEHFELRLTERTSYRLMKTRNLVEQIHNHNDTILKSVHANL